MIVVDASAMLEVLLRTSAAPAVEAWVFRPGETLHAPHLLDLEVTQVLRRYAASGQVSSLRCSQALTDWASFPLNRYPHDVLLPRVWQLRANLTAYAAAYIALAEALNATLVTRDRRLASSAIHRARIELV